METQQFDTQWQQLKDKARQRWNRLTKEDIDAVNGRQDELEKKIQERHGVSADEARKQVAQFVQQNGSSGQGGRQGQGNEQGGGNQQNQQQGGQRPGGQQMGQGGEQKGGQGGQRPGQQSGQMGQGGQTGQSGQTGGRQKEAGSSQRREDGTSGGE